MLSRGEDVEVNALVPGMEHLRHSPVTSVERLRRSRPPSTWTTPRSSSAWRRCTAAPRNYCRNGSPGGAGPVDGRRATTGRRRDRGRMHTGSMRQVIRLPEPKVRPEGEARRQAGADILRPYRGRFVGQKDERVLIDADDQHDVVAWLREHGINGATVFRVPLDPTVDILAAVGPTDLPAAAER